MTSAQGQELSAIGAVIDRLSQLTGPDRETDEYLALIDGWRLAGETDQPREQLPRGQREWIEPTTQKRGRVPFYTSNIQEAFEFLKRAAPDNAVACAWWPDKGAAKLGEDISVMAQTPAIALCIAALKGMASRRAAAS